MSDDDLSEAFQRRGAVGIVMMVVPIVSIVAVGLGYAGLMWFGLAVQLPTGPLTTVHFDGCSEAGPLVRARAEQIGLTELELQDSPGGFDLVVRMPTDERVAKGIPATLAAPGRFRVEGLAQDGSPTGEVLVTEADIADSTVYMNFLDAPRAHVILTQEAGRSLRDWQQERPDQGLQLVLDDRKANTLANLPTLTSGTLDLDLPGATDLARMDFVAAASVVLAHGPLPCELTVVDVTQAERQQP